MKIFLTGSNGYIGRNFIKKASKNNQIFALTRKKKNPKMRNVKWLVGEIDKNWKELTVKDVEKMNQFFLSENDEKCS